MQTPFAVLIVVLTVLASAACATSDQSSATGRNADTATLSAQPTQATSVPMPDSAALAVRAELASDSADAIVVSTRHASRGKKDSISLAHSIRDGLKNPGWPVLSPALLPGSILPAKRIIAYYGNPLSKKMGILGELPPTEMLAKFETELAAWRSADPSTPVQPALHLVAAVAQGTPGKDSLYRYRIHPDLIAKVHGWAKQKNAILFLDIQTGFSTVEAELAHLLPYLRQPDVHFGIDPEFHMHYNRAGVKPGAKIGTVTAKEINQTIEQLAKLVTDHNLPPKVLVIHRFTTNMLQGASEIRLDPRVQVVIDMDGWGQPWLKFDSYRSYIVSEPVQFTGIKLFYKNDTKKGDVLLMPREILALRPRPLYIQYQ